MSFYFLHKFLSFTQVGKGSEQTCSMSLQLAQHHFCATSLTKMLLVFPFFNFLVCVTPGLGSVYSIDPENCSLKANISTCIILKVQWLEAGFKFLYSLIEMTFGSLFLDVYDAFHKILKLVQVQRKRKLAH